MKRPLTKQEFVEACMHELRGHALGLAINERRGAQLSMAFKAITNQLTNRLGELYDQIVQVPDGTPAKPDAKPGQSAPAATGQTKRT